MASSFNQNANNLFKLDDDDTYDNGDFNEGNDGSGDDDLSLVVGKALRIWLDTPQISKKMHRDLAGVEQQIQRHYPGVMPKLIQELEACSGMGRIHDMMPVRLWVLPKDQPVVTRALMTEIHHAVTDLAKSKMNGELESQS